MEQEHHLINKVVTFTESVDDYSLPFEPDMKAKIISA